MSEYMSLRPVARDTQLLEHVKPILKGRGPEEALSTYQITTRLASLLGIEGEDRYCIKETLKRLKDRGFLGHKEQLARGGRRSRHFFYDPETPAAQEELPLAAEEKVGEGTYDGGGWFQHIDNGREVKQIIVINDAPHIVSRTKYADGSSTIFVTTMCWDDGL